VAAASRWLVQTLAVILLVMIGTTILLRFAPGYFSDAREMDARYAAVARAELSAEVARSHSLPRMLAIEIGGWIHGNSGVSRQFGVPVWELIQPRLAVSGALLLRGVALAWMLALCVSILSSAGRRPSLLWQVPAAILLAVPAAALATLCLLINSGGPVLVLALLLAARDFKFLHRALHQAWLDPHVLHARAQGVRTQHLLRAHIVPALLPQLGALASLSIVTALSALVPIEVIFNVPGIGELAWNAAINRDLPVLLAVTMILALAVVCSGVGSRRTAAWREA
jgi:peptide/nickel transport system permease protein